MSKITDSISCSGRSLAGNVRQIYVVAIMKHQTSIRSEKLRFLKSLFFVRGQNLFNFCNKNNYPNYQRVIQHLKKYLIKHLLIQKHCLSLFRDCNSAVT